PPLPPLSSLFSSPTLFRSPRDFAVPAAAHSPSAVMSSTDPRRRRQGPSAEMTKEKPAPPSAHARYHGSAHAAGTPKASTRSRTIDRKSTRLNSSHVSISYA